MSERVLTITIGVVAGIAWNLASLWCLSRLLAAWLGPSPSKRRAIGWLLVKFPLLYLLAFALVRGSSVSLIGFGAGFSAVLVVMLAAFALRAQRRIAVPSNGR